MAMHYHVINQSNRILKHRHTPLGRNHTHGGVRGYAQGYTSILSQQEATIERIKVHMAELKAHRPRYNEGTS